MEKGREEEGRGHRGKGMWPSSAETYSLDPGGGERHGGERKPMAMTERKGFTKVPEFDGSASTFEVWSYKMRGFLQSEPGYRGLLE